MRMRRRGRLKASVAPVCAASASRSPFRSCRSRVRARRRPTARRWRRRRPRPRSASVPTGVVAAGGTPADLEQAHAGLLARGIAAECRDQPGQQCRPHHAEFRAERIGQRQACRASAGVEPGRVHEGVAIVEEVASHELLAQVVLRHLRFAGYGDQRCASRHRAATSGSRRSRGCARFLDQVFLDRQVEAAGRRRHPPAIRRVST